MPLYSSLETEIWLINDMGGPEGSSSSYFSGLEIGDIDNNGIPEIYFPIEDNYNNMAGFYQYIYQSSTYNWSTRKIMGDELKIIKMIFGDGDNDDKNEFYVVGTAQPSLPSYLMQIQYENNKWIKYDIEINQTKSFADDIYMGDINNDGRIELIEITREQNINMIYKSDNWKSIHIGSSEEISPNRRDPIHRLAIADGNNDGSNEIYVTSESGDIYQFSYSTLTFSWTRTLLGQVKTSNTLGYKINIKIDDLDHDNQNEIYVSSCDVIQKFIYDQNASSWINNTIFSLENNGFSIMGLAMADIDADGSNEIYISGFNRELFVDGRIYKLSRDKMSGDWTPSHIGNIKDKKFFEIATGSAMGDPSQKEIYVTCSDGHAYQLIMERPAPANPVVWSDTHPQPGTWYTNNIVHVLWTNISEASGYSLVWDNSPSTIPDDKIDVEASIHDATSSPLEPGKWYFHIRARGRNLRWNSSAAHFGPICIGTPPDLNPPVISDVSVSGITDTQAVVTWRTSEPADSRVEYGPTTSYGRFVSDESLVLSHSIELSGLSPSTTYHFRVVSRSGGGALATGEDHTFTTASSPDLRPPVIFNAGVEGITGNSAVVVWETDEPSDSRADFGPTTSYGLSASDGTLVLRHSLLLSGLSPGASYHVRPRSQDRAGNAATGPDLTFRTMETPIPPDRAPPVISDVRVEGISTDRAVVTWRTDELADSEVDYGLSAEYGLSARDPGHVLFHSVMLRDLSPSTRYHLRVKSTDVFGNGPSVSEDIVFNTSAAPDSAPPVITGIVVLNITNTSAVVSWVTDELSDSLVEFGTDVHYGQVLSSGVLVRNHSMQLAGLTQGTTYHFRVRSRDASGNWAPWSADMTFTTLKGAGPGPAPPPPARGAGITTAGTPLLLWLPLGLAVIGALLAVCGWRRKGARSPPAPPGTPGAAPQPPVEEIETLEMEEALPGAPLGPGPPGPPEGWIEEAPAQPPSPLPSPPTALKQIECTGCRTRFYIQPASYPLRVTCPSCGRAGVYRGLSVPRQ